MSNRLDKWRAGPFSAYPNFSSPYWRALPLRRMKNLLLGIFFVAAGVGFVMDLLQNDVDYRPLGQGFFWPVMLGAGMAILFVARIKRSRLVLPGALAWLVLVKLVDRGPTAWSLPYVLQHRHALYAIGIGLSVGVGYKISVLVSQHCGTGERPRAHRACSGPGHPGHFGSHDFSTERDV
jgi:hypothetical protein